MSTAPEPIATLLARPEGTSFTVTTWSADPSAPAGRETPVILIQPAMGMPAGYYHRLGEAIAAAGFHAALTELRGHEANGGRLPSHRYDFGYQDMIEDLDTAVAEVERRFPGAPLVLIGHSMGGQLGVAYAAAQPTRLSGLILIGSGTPYWRDFGLWLLPVAPLLVAISQALGHLPGKQLKFAGRESRGLTRDWAKLALTGRLTGATGAQLDAAELPLLAITIEGDTLAPRGSVEGLVALMPHADVARHHINEPGVDHFKWARRPETAVPAIAAWIDAAVRPPS